MTVVRKRLLISGVVALILAGMLAVGLTLMGPPPSLTFLAGLIVPRGHAFRPAETDLPPCVDRTPLLATALADQPRATCDPTGLDVVFPDGHRMTIGPPLGNQSESTFSAKSGEGPTYTNINFGIYGVCAAERSGDNKKSWWWGRTEAIRFCQEGGKDAPTNHD